MKPLQSKDGGAMRKGLANEDRIIKSLAKYVFEYSHGKYKVKHIRTYGLLVRRDVQACSSSPDGVFALLERQGDGSYQFVELCVLEVKTQSALGTVDAVYRQSLNGNKFTECSSGTALSKESVREPPYRSQICQHAAALVERVLIIFSLPGALPQKMVLVTVLDEHRHTLLILQQIVAERYLLVCYSPGSPAVMPDMGED